MRRLWSQMPSGSSWQQAYDDHLSAQMTMLLTAAQIASTRESDSYIATVLNELALGEAAKAGVVNPRGIAGFAGNGLSIATMLQLPVTRAAETFEDLSQAAKLAPKGAPSNAQMASMALGTSRDYLDLIVSEIMRETARATESAAMADREWVQGWVRVITGAHTCSRCVVLAGKFYRWDAAFDRHPGCDCDQIPAAEKGDGDVRTNPNTYFDSLSIEQQNKTFGKAGAQAIRDGADISQVVNARSGMRKAQVFNRDVLVTTSGTTKRAWYGGGYAAKKYGFEDWFNRSGYTGRNVGKRGRVTNYTERRTNNVRLMPESIYAIAKDRPDAIRLLKMYGYLL